MESIASAYCCLSTKQRSLLACTGNFLTCLKLSPMLSLNTYRTALVLSSTYCSCITFLFT